MMFDVHRGYQFWLLQQNSLLEYASERLSSRAGDGIRTHDSLLGKQIRYHCVTPALRTIIIILIR